METTTSDAATKGEKLFEFFHHLSSHRICCRVCAPNFSVCCVPRLQRPNVYLPVHLYGQLVHDKTGCHLLEAQVTASACSTAHSVLSFPWGAVGCADLAIFLPNSFSVCLQSVVPDLSYTVRSPMLDTWEGIKQLKAALWALVCITCCQFMSPQLLCRCDNSYKDMALMVFVVFFAGQHWLFKLGSESPAGGERHSWHPRTGSALWRAVSTRVSLLYPVFTRNKHPDYIFNSISRSWCSPRLYVPMHLKVVLFSPETTQCSQ